MVWDKWAALALVVVLASLTTCIVMVPESRAVLLTAVAGIAAAVLQSLRGPVARPYVETRTPDQTPPPPKDTH